jgi:hypothetical protein
MEYTETSSERSDDDIERKWLLEIIYKNGVYALTRSELERLHTLLELKSYGENRKANRSKKKLLKKINIAIYEYSQEGQHESVRI